jgi:hypothetical protein
MLSTSPHDNHNLPKDIKDVDVYLKSACVLTFHQDTGSNVATDPCYKMEFHAGILEEGNFKRMSVLVTKLFQPPVINPCKNVQIDIGMVVKVSGKLTAQRPNNDQAGITAFFHIDATAIERDIHHSEAIEHNDKQRVSRNPLYTPNIFKLGAFKC